jgi:hypothetical protein
MAELEALTGFGLGIVCLVWANGSHSACVVVSIPTKKSCLESNEKSSSSKESLPACEPYLPSRGESGGFIRPAQIPLIQDVRSLSPLRQTRRTHHQRHMQVTAMSHFGLAPPYSTQFLFLCTHSVPPLYPEQPRTVSCHEPSLAPAKTRGGLLSQPRGRCGSSVYELFFYLRNQVFIPDSSRRQSIAPSHHAIPHDTQVLPPSLPTARSRPAGQSQTIYLLHGVPASSPKIHRYV